MNVRCLHCNHSFQHVVPSYARGSATAVCPSCGRDTPATEEWGLDSGTGAVENRVYCFNCGRAMTPRDGELIPVCDDCRQEQKGQDAPEGAAPAADEPVADWMIRKANGNVYGPFPQATIVEWIRARKINPDEEVAHIGGSWRLFSKHEEFARFFETRVEAVVVPASAELDFRRRNPFRDGLRAGGRVFGALAVLGGAALGVWYSIRHDVLVIPEATIDTVARKVEDAAAGASRPVEAPPSEIASRLLRDLKTAWPTVTGSSMEHTLRGRTYLRRGNAPNLKKAQEELEQAVVLDAQNPLALAGLAEAYALLVRTGVGSLDLQPKIIYLLEQATRQASFGAEVMRANATFLIYSGSALDGAKVAEQALQQTPRDAELHALLGVARLDKAGAPTDGSALHFRQALELDPGLHQVYLEMARSERIARRLKDAIGHYEQKIERDPASAEANAELGAIWEEVGDRTRAVAHYDRALAVDPKHRVAAQRRALIAMQLEGDPARAVALLGAIHGDEGKDVHLQARRETAVTYAAAQRLAGQPAKAKEAMDALLKEDPNYGPALFQRAMANAAVGRSAESMTDFVNAEGSEFSTQELARVYAYSGRVALAARRLQDAEAEFRKAIELDESYMPAALGLASVQMELGDSVSAAQSLTAHLRPDPLDFTRQRDLSPIWDRPADPMPLAEKLAVALKKAGFAPAIDAALGMVLFHAGHIDQARKALARATEEDDRNEAARFYRGLVEYQEGNYAAAGAHFRALVDLSHDQGVFHAYLADTLLEQGRTDEAIDAYRRAQQYGGQSPWILTRFAQALASKDQKDQARAELDRAVTLDPAAVAPRRARFDLNL